MTRRGVLTGGTWCIDRNLLVDRWPRSNGRADILERQDRAAAGRAATWRSTFASSIRIFPSRPSRSSATTMDGQFLARARRRARHRSRRRMHVTIEAATDYTHAFSDRSDRPAHPHQLFRHEPSAHARPFRFLGLRSSPGFISGCPASTSIMDAPWAGEANGWVATLKKARAAGLKTNLELASIAPDRLAALVRPCLPHLDLLIVNDARNRRHCRHRDGCRTAGPIPPPASRRRRRCSTLGRCELVAVHFPAGRVVAGRDGGVTTRPSVNVPPAEVAGANGAGDAFAAGFLYGISRGLERRTCSQARACGRCRLAARNLDHRRHRSLGRSVSPLPKVGMARSHDLK